MKLIKLEALAEAAECLRSLAHPVRLRIVEVLLQKDVTVGDLAEVCGTAPHVTSEHLGKMRDKGLLKSERRGRCIYYSIANPGLQGILSCVDRNFGSQKEDWSI
ncbi:MAG: metalloregulator ArsR/SmtB family transcription factor [Planctomycetota bacterium]